MIFSESAACEHGVRPTILRWIDFLLKSRDIFVDIRGIGAHMSV
jgi:hypothetical protein